MPAESDVDDIFGALPDEAQAWFEKLPWAKRRYVLSLCHLMSASPPEKQAEFLDNYTADGLVYRVIRDQATQQKVHSHLRKFHIGIQLTETVLRTYIRQFYIHSAQDARQQPGLYLESALRLVASTQEKNSVFYYILGFELIRMVFQMSWAEQERFYRLQINQEAFLERYVKPVRYAHRLNNIIVPRDEGYFFARRDYFVERPQISSKRLTELVMVTFTTKAVTSLGFALIRTPNSFQFDHAYVFQEESVGVIPD